MALSWICLWFWCNAWPAVKVYFIAAVYLLKERFWKLDSIPALSDENARNLQAIVTGGNRGIGLEIARILAKRHGFNVLICGIDSSVGLAACVSINQQCNKELVRFEHLDLASLDSVNEFCSKILSKFVAVHLLINNAGVMMTPFRRSENGMEYQWAVNVVGPFYLTIKLIPLLKHGAAVDGFGRVINVCSSTVHCAAPMEFKAYSKSAVTVPSTISKNLYSSHAAYYTSKVAVLFITKMLQEKLNAEDDVYINNNRVTVVSLHPGVVLTHLVRAAEDVVSLCLTGDVLPGAYYENGVRVCFSGGAQFEEFESTAKTLWTDLESLQPV